MQPGLFSFTYVDANGESVSGFVGVAATTESAYTVSIATESPLFEANRPILMDIMNSFALGNL